MQENMDRQQNEIRKATHEQNEKFKKEIEIIREMKHKFWFLKNITTKLKFNQKFQQYT